MRATIVYNDETAKESHTYDNIDAVHFHENGGALVSFGGDSPEDTHELNNVEAVHVYES